MKCHLYMCLIDGTSRRRGPYDICDEAQARKMAQAELQRDPSVTAIDIWWDNGELYRIERPAEPVAGGAGAAWSRAFSGSSGRGTRA